MTDLHKNLAFSYDAVDKFMSIASYAALLGEIDERNLLYLMRYGRVDLSNKKFFSLLGLYVETGVIKLTGGTNLKERLKEARKGKKNTADVQKIKKMIQKMRKKYLEE